MYFGLSPCCSSGVSIAGGEGDAGREGRQFTRCAEPGVARMEGLAGRAVVARREVGLRAGGAHAAAAARADPEVSGPPPLAGGGAGDEPGL